MERQPAFKALLLRLDNFKLTKGKYMPFTIESEGSRQGVVDFVKAQKELGPDGKTPAADQTQIETAKTLIQAELATLDTKYNGVRVNCQGQTAPSARQISLIITGRQFHL